MCSSPASLIVNLSFASGFGMMYSMKPGSFCLCRARMVRLATNTPASFSLTLKANPSDDSSSLGMTCLEVENSDVSSNTGDGRWVVASVVVVVVVVVVDVVVETVVVVVVVGGRGSLMLTRTKVDAFLPSEVTII